MTANIAPIFALVPEIKRAVITAATTDKSGAVPTNLVELCVGGTNGSKLTWIKFKHAGSSTAGIYLVFVTDTAGANPRLYAEMAITAIGSSVTVLSHEATLFLADFQLNAGQKVLVGATSASSNIHVTGSFGDF